jgi:hypothetical protein
MPRRIRSVFTAIAALALFAPSARALDIDSIEVLWLTDQVAGTPITDPFGMEIFVELLNDTNLGRIEVVTPGAGIGSFDLTNGGSGLSYEIPGSVTTAFATSATLFGDFPGGSWTFNFRDGSDAIVDSFNILLNPSEVTDLLAVTNPAHMGSFDDGDALTWSDCSGCTSGNRIVGVAIDVPSDSEVDFFTTTDLTTTSWTPTNLTVGNAVEFEMILGNYSHAQTSEQTTGLDGFTFLAGYENINAVSATVIPEPCTGLLLATSLGALGIQRRHRSRVKHRTRSRSE